MPGPKPLLTQAQVEELRKLRNNGLTYTRLAYHILTTYDLYISRKSVFYYVTNNSKRGR